MTNSVQYATAYTVSNEYLRWTTGHFADAKRVLTVAASGDQAMFHKLAGATHIDTFDRTPYANYMQEIKFAAIGRLNRAEYFNLLIDLNKTFPGRVRDIPALRHIMPYMSNKIVNEIKERDQGLYKMFGAGSAINIYDHNMLTQDEYMRLRSGLKEPFNFILSDIRELHTHINISDANYDLINTSNILDYIHTAEQGTVLKNLTRLLKVGGKIIHIPQNTNVDYKKVKLMDSDARVLEYVTEIPHPTDRFTSIVVFQRTR